MTTLIARAKALWAREPVLVAAVLPVAVSVGLLTATQANAVTAGLASAAAVVAQLVAAWQVRAVVKSPATAAKEAAKIVAAVPPAAP